MRRALALAAVMPMLALAPAGAASAAPPVTQAERPATGECLTRLCNARAIERFLGQLRRQPNRALHIMQIGDSLTVGDMIPRGWRQLFQDWHGSGGRGVLALGKPFAGSITWGVTAAQSGRWSTNSIFGGSWSEGGPVLGISGFTQTARSPGAVISLMADNAENRFDIVSLCGATGPNAGSVQVHFGTSPPPPIVQPSVPLDPSQPVPAPSGPPSLMLDFAADTPGARCQSFVSPQRTDKVTFTTLTEKTVSLTSMATFRNERGVVLSNLGVVGSQMQHLNRATTQVVETELAFYQPDLVVLAFGTNEGFNPRLSGDTFAATLRSRVQLLRRVLGPSQPILLILPPDALTLSDATARIDLPEAVPCGSGLKAPAGLAIVRRQERALAREMGLAIWDANRAMGGACSALKWREDGMMLPDLVHLNKDGGTVLGTMLAADLEQAVVAGTPAD